MSAYNLSRSVLKEMFHFVFFYLGIFHLKTNSNISIDWKIFFHLRGIFSKERKHFLRNVFGKISAKQETKSLLLSHKRRSTVSKNLGGLRVCVMCVFFFSLYLRRACERVLIPLDRICSTDRFYSLHVSFFNARHCHRKYTGGSILCI